MSLNFRTDHTEFFRLRISIAGCSVTITQKYTQRRRFCGDCTFRESGHKPYFLHSRRSRARNLLLTRLGPERLERGGCCFAKTFPSSIQTLLLLLQGIRILSSFREETPFFHVRFLFVPSLGSWMRPRKSCSFSCLLPKSSERDSRKL